MYKEVNQLSPMSFTRGNLLSDFCSAVLLRGVEITFVQRTNIQRIQPYSLCPLLS
jgi:hypothetical protein